MTVENGLRYGCLWSVAPDYRLRGDAVLEACGAEEQVETYDAGGEASLPADFARINRRMAGVPATEEAKPQIQALLTFARTFGKLGKQQLADNPANLHHTNQASIKFYDNDGCEYVTKCRSQTPPNEAKRCVEESFGWICAHASSVDTCLLLAGWICTGDVEMVRACLSRFLKAQTTPGGFQLAASHTMMAMSFDLKSRTDKQVEEAAWGIIETILRFNLTNARRTIIGGKSRLEFDALLSVIYWKTADWIASGKLRRCNECGVYFQAHDNRQKYCPPSRGSAESLCSMRERSRRKRGGSAKVDAQRANPASLQELFWSPDLPTGYRSEDS